MPTSDEVAALQYLLTDRSLALATNGRSVFNPLNRIVFDVLHAYYIEFKDPPTRSTIIREVKKLISHKTISESQLPYLARLIAQLFKRIENPKYNQAEAIKFLRKAIGKEALKRSVDLLEKEDYDSIYQEILRIKSFGEIDGEEDEYVYFGAKRDYSDEKRIPTGIEKLDRCIGGMGKKELFAVLGLPKAGKSITLLNFAASAILSGYKAAIYTLEISAKKTMRRFDSRFSGLPYDEIPKKNGALNERLKSIREDYLKSLIIKGFPTGKMTPSMLEAHLDRLETKFKFIPDLVVVDYADIMRPEQKSPILRHELKDIYENLRRIAQERDVAMLTATQSNRLGMSRRVLTIQELSEAFSKAFVADIIVSICASPGETAQNLMRYYVAVSRETKAGVPVLVKTEFERMLITEP